MRNFLFGFFLFLTVLIASCSPVLAHSPELTVEVAESLEADLNLISLVSTEPASIVETVTPFPTLDSRSSVVITIDDGLVAEAFDQILQVLASRGVHATFFLTANAVTRNLGSERMVALVLGGHEIAYHSVEHGEMEELASWSAAEWEQDYQDWLAIMRTLLPEDLQDAIKPYARPPYGLKTLGFLDFCEKENLSCWWWNAGPDTLNLNFPIRDGDIFIFHVRHSDLAAFEAFLARQSEFQFLSLSEYLAE